MCRTTCRTILEVLFFALFLADVEAAPAKRDAIQVRQQGLDPTRMVKTITKTNNQAGQTLTEICYFWPSSPTDQTCSTTVAWTTDEDRDDDGRTNTIWPEEPSGEQPNTQNIQQANPTSVMLPTVLYPTAQPSQSSLARPTTDIVAAIITQSVESPTASDLVVAETKVSSAIAADRSAASSDDQDGQIVIKAEESEPFPGQHLAVLPIGLGIYCSIMGLGLLVVTYMTLVRMKYRREYRQRKKGVRTGLGVAMGVGMGLDSRFAASEVRRA